MNISPYTLFMLTRLLICLLLGAGVRLRPVDSSTNASPSTLRVATVDIDVTPPIGSWMDYDPVTNTWDLGLRARGVVLRGFPNRPSFFRTLGKPSQNLSPRQQRIVQNVHYPKSILRSSAYGFA